MRQRQKLKKQRNKGKNKTKKIDQLEEMGMNKEKKDLNKHWDNLKATQKYKKK